MDFKSLINVSEMPSHVAIIMDGNGRWAKEHNKPRIFGHKNGVLSVRDVVEGAGEIGLKFLTLYAFSTENWNRPKVEITALMQLLVATLSKEVATLNKNNVRLMAIGDLQSLPNNCEKELQKSIEKTKKNTGLTLVLALSYSSKWEIINAVKKITSDVIEELNLIRDTQDIQTYEETLYGVLQDWINWNEARGLGNYTIRVVFSNLRKYLFHLGIKTHDQEIKEYLRFGKKSKEEKCDGSFIYSGESDCLEQADKLRF